MRDLATLKAEAFALQTDEERLAWSESLIPEERALLTRFIADVMKHVEEWIDSYYEYLKPVYDAWVMKIQTYGEVLREAGLISDDT